MAPQWSAKAPPWSAKAAEPSCRGRPATDSRVRTRSLECLRAAIADGHRLGRSARSVRPRQLQRHGERLSTRSSSGFFATHGVFAHQRVTGAMRRQAIEALDRVGAAPLAAQTLDTMSTGEARRVLIARALVHKPKALVLDEPTRGLDLVARHRSWSACATIARQGTTILLVTHHVDEIIPEIDRVVLLERGRIAFDGPKRDVLTGPRLSRSSTAAGRPRGRRLLPRPRELKGAARSP